MGPMGTDMRTDLKPVAIMVPRIVVTDSRHHSLGSVVAFFYCDDLAAGVSI